MNPGFQPHDRHAVLGCALLQAGQDRARDSEFAIFGAHVHALDLTVLRDEELNAAASGGKSADPSQEEYNPFAQELFDAIAVLTLLWIEGGQLSLEFGDQLHG